jgi:uncharacterized membrane protein
MTKIKKDITVGAPVDIVYAVWRNFENFPSFMGNIEDVRVSSDRLSHWKAKGPLGVAAEWDAEITLDKPDQAVGWRTVEGASSVITAGRVNFKRMGERTKLDVTIEYAPPGGPIGDLVAKIFSNPEKHVEEDLERFREVIEHEVDMAAAGSPSEGESLGGSMGAVTEHDLTEASRIKAAGNVPPEENDPLGPTPAPPDRESKKTWTD